LNGGEIHIGKHLNTTASTPANALSRTTNPLNKTSHDKVVGQNVAVSDMQLVFSFDRTMWNESRLNFSQSHSVPPLLTSLLEIIQHSQWGPTG
jgi:hypothetical protein